MALTVSEAHDVNTLLDWILGIRRPSSDKTDDELAVEAQAAAGRLADKASKTLMAGLDLTRVNEAWALVDARPWQEACRVCGCTDENACFGGCFWVAPGLCSECGVTPVPGGGGSDG